MYHYKCDKCGAPLFIDPNEERICDRCRERQKESGQRRMTYVRESVKESSVRYAS